MWQVCSRLRHCLLLLRGLAVGRLVLLQGGGTAAVEEVDGDTGLTATVGRGEAAIEVREKVDLLAVESTLGKDTGHGNANIGLGVCCYGRVN